MRLQTFAEDSDRFVREYEYDGLRVIAVDLGGREASVDVVGNTAIVVLEDGEQFEIDLPDDRDVDAFIRNGVLSIEVNEA